MLCRWAWVAPAPFYAMAIGIKLTAGALGDTSKRSPLLVNPTNATDSSLARQGQHRLKAGHPPFSLRILSSAFASWRAAAAG